MHAVVIFPQLSLREGAPFTPTLQSPLSITSLRGVPQARVMQSLVPRSPPVSQICHCEEPTPPLSLRGAKRRSNLWYQSTVQTRMGNHKREIATAPTGPRNDNSQNPHFPYCHCEEGRFLSRRGNLWCLRTT